MMQAHLYLMNQGLSSVCLPPSLEIPDTCTGAWSYFLSVAASSRSCMSQKPHKYTHTYLDDIDKDIYNKSLCTNDQLTAIQDTIRVSSGSRRFPLKDQHLCVGNTVCADSTFQIRAEISTLEAVSYLNNYGAFVASVIKCDQMDSRGPVDTSSALVVDSIKHGNTYLFYVLLGHFSVSNARGIWIEHGACGLFTLPVFMPRGKVKAADEVFPIRRLAEEKKTKLSPAVYNSLSFVLGIIFAGILIHYVHHGYPEFYDNHRNVLLEAPEDA